MPGVLDGLRVIEGSAFVAAPMAGMTLAQILEAIEMRAALEAHLLRKAAKRLDGTPVVRFPPRS